MSVGGLDDPQSSWYDNRWFPTESHSDAISKTSQLNQIYHYRYLGNRFKK